MKNIIARCYRELVECATVHEEPLALCQIYMEMMQNNWWLDFSDFCNALELSIQFPDCEMYWEIRKQLWLREDLSDHKLPDHLLWPGEGNDKHQNNLLLPHEGRKEADTATAEVILRRKILDDVRKAGGSVLTNAVAPKLLLTMATHKCNEECAELLQYSRINGISPKAKALLAAFQTLENGLWFDEALDVVEGMLSNELILKSGIYTRALGVALKVKRYGLVARLSRDMLKHGVDVTTSRRNAMIRACAGEKEWELTEFVRCCEN